MKVRAFSLPKSGGGKRLRSLLISPPSPPRSYERSNSRTECPFRKGNVFRAGSPEERLDVTPIQISFFFLLSQLQARALRSIARLSCN